MKNQNEVSCVYSLRQDVHQVFDLFGGHAPLDFIYKRPLPLSRAFSHSQSLAFTVVELLAVIAIIAIVATIAFPSYRALVDRSRTAACVSNLQQCSGLLSA